MTFPITQGPTIAPKPTPAPEVQAGGSGGSSPASSSGAAPAGGSGSAPKAGSGSGAVAAPAPHAAAGGSAPAETAPAYGSGSGSSGAGSSPAGGSGSSPAGAAAPAASSDIPCDGCEAPSPNGLSSNGTAPGLTPYSPNSATKATTTSLISIVLAAVGFMML